MNRRCISRQTQRRFSVYQPMQLTTSIKLLHVSAQKLQPQEDFCKKGIPIQHANPRTDLSHWHHKNIKILEYQKLTCIKLQCWDINLLKPTGYVMHLQFNIQQLYVLPTLYLCVLYLSKNKQRLVPLTA